LSVILRQYGSLSKEKKKRYHAILNESILVFFCLIWCCNCGLEWCGGEEVR